MPAVISEEARARALLSLREAENLLAATPLKNREDLKAEALVVALLRDQYVPVTLFKDWASPRTFRYWRDDPQHKLDVVVRHGRTCVRPSAFFALWERLPCASKKVNLSSAGHNAGQLSASRGGRAPTNPRAAEAARG